MFQKTTPIIGVLLCTTCIAMIGLFLTYPYESQTSPINQPNQPFASKPQLESTIQQVDLTLATKIVNDCATITTQEDRKTCFESQILTTINVDPTQVDSIFSGLWQMAVQGKISDDPRIFLDIAHEAGMMLESEKISLSKAFTYCGISFKQGCMRGYIMEYVDDKYPGDVEPETLKTICEKLNDPQSKNNCIHGLGHELAAKIKKDLPTVLSSCKEIATNAYELSACQSGVFMEYSKGIAGSGRHSHEPVGTKSLPCADLPDEYKSVCIASEGAYRQYNPGHEDFKTTYNFCSSNGEKYSTSCRMAVSERAIIATAENANREIFLCNQLSKDQSSLCIDALIKVSKTQFDNKNLTAKLQEYQSKLSN